MAPLPQDQPIPLRRRAAVVGTDAGSPLLLQPPSARENTKPTPTPAQMRPRKQTRFVVPTPAAAPATGERREGFRADIEGLRAVAILLVVLYHAGIKQLPGGFVGVDVFFVISGFLITGHLMRDIDRDRLSIARFYARRALRLLPAATLVIAATTAATWYWAPATRLKGVTLDAVAANLYFINYRLAAIGTDYRTAAAPPSPLQHFWSLAVEEQFYLLIPVLLMLVAMLVRRRIAFIAVIGALTGISFWWSIVYTQKQATWAYFSTTSRAWELGAGALLALLVLSASRMALPQPAAFVLRYGGIAAIAWAAWSFTDTTPFPSYWAGVPVLGAVAIIAAGHTRPDDPLVGNPLFLAIGARSYSWYLWHWPVLMIAPFILKQELTLWMSLAAVALAYGLAAFTYEVFERPMRENHTLRNSPFKAGRFGLALTAGVCALAVALPYAPTRQPLGTGAVAAVHLEGSGSARMKALAAKIETASQVQTLPANLNPSLQAAANDVPIVYTDGCHLSFVPDATPKRCERFGDPKAKDTVVLFGDSHAAQWFPAMQKIAKDKKFRLVNYTKSACSTATITMFREDLKGAYEACDTWRERVLKKMVKIKPKVIVLAANYGGYANNLTGPPEQVDAVWVHAYEITIRRLQKDLPKTQLVFMNDTPWPKGNAADCLALHPTDIQACARSLKEATSDSRRQKVLAAMNDWKITVIDPMPWFCTLKRCPPVVGNLLVYMDQSHVTPEYAELLAPLLGEQLHVGKAKKPKKKVT